MSILDAAGRAAYQLGFQISPIILTGGIAANFYGYLPIIAITEAGAIGSVSAIRSLANIQGLDGFFAHFRPVPGGKLANYAVGTYPFANQSVAANAIIAEPLTISMRMEIPVNKAGGHARKLITMMALQSALQKHANLGGTYIVATPAGMYTDCILTSLSDVSGGESPTPQTAWQFDFVKPLVTLRAAQAAQSTLMQSATNGTPTDGAWTASSAGGAVPTTSAGATPLGINVPAMGVQGPGQ